MYSGNFLVEKCSNPPAGYLQITSVQNVSITFHEPVSKNQAYLAYTNFVQDTFCYKTFGYSYEAYIEKIIDKLIDQASSDGVTGNHRQHANKIHGAVTPNSPVSKRTYASFFNVFPHLDVVFGHVASNIFDSEKNLDF